MTARRDTRWGLLVALWAVPAALSALQTLANLVLRDELATQWPFLFIAVGIWWSWAPLTPPILALARRWPLAEPRAPLVLRHLGAALGLTLAHGLLWAAITFWIQRRIEPGPQRLGWVTMYAAYLATRIVTGLLTYGVIVAVGTARDSLRRLRDEELRATRLGAQLTAAQLGALKMQLHPHFLFNTLHAVTVLIREDPPAAARTVTRLADLLRLTLARATRTEVTLARELELVRLYLEIERTRFADRLRVTYEIAPDAEPALVPDLVLQPLVENAIRHGIAPSSAAGCLTIRARRDGDALVLEVQDDGPGPHGPGPHGSEPHAAREPGTGIGLSTTRARLAALHGDAARCELREAPGGGALARLTLPWRVAAVADAA